MRNGILSAVAVLCAVCICGCTSYDSIIKDHIRDFEDKMSDAKSKPLRPLPDYPKDAQASYDTSAALMVIGNDDARKVFCAALGKAGCCILDATDNQTSEFRAPDVVLCPSYACSAVCGDGAVWCQVRLVVSTRDAVRLDKTGTVERMRDPRIFQVYARMKTDDVYATLKTFAGSAFYQHLPADSKNRVRIEEVEREAVQTAISRLMRIDAFRREIAKKRDSRHGDKQ